MKRPHSFFHLFFSAEKLFFLLIVLYTTSCNIINPAEPVPAYVRADSITLISSAGQGTSSSKIVDAWVYVDGTIIGAFEMPVTLPVLSAGSHKLTIRPGILVNGIAATRTIYPFYTGYDSIVNFESEKIIMSAPIVNYLSSTHFSQLENFDSVGTSLKKYSGSDTTITPIQDQYSFERKYGAVHLDPLHSTFICASVDSFPLPTGGVPVYAELNFSCDNEFTVGLITYTANSTYTDDIVTFNPSATWKKEYVNLTPYVSATVNALGYKIFIKAIKRSDVANTYLFLDNIKVIH